MLTAIAEQMSDSYHDSMNAISTVGRLLVCAREAAGVTQREMAQRAGTAQSVVARIERGQANPTIGTLERLFEAAGVELTMAVAPLQAGDPVVEAYKRDVDRSLLRENLKRDVTSRLRMNAELQAFAQEARTSGRRRRR